MRASFNSPSPPRQTASGRARRSRLLAEAIRRHGIPGIAALLRLLEPELGEEIGIDRRLERLIEAEPLALALLAAPKDGEP